MKSNVILVAAVAVILCIVGGHFLHNYRERVELDKMMERSLQLEDKSLSYVRLAVSCPKEATNDEEKYYCLYTNLDSAIKYRGMNLLYDEKILLTLKNRAKESNSKKLHKQITVLEQVCKQSWDQYYTIVDLRKFTYISYRQKQLENE